MNDQPDDKPIETWIVCDSEGDEHTVWGDEWHCDGKSPDSFDCDLVVEYKRRHVAVLHNYRWLKRSDQLAGPEHIQFQHSKQAVRP